MVLKNQKPDFLPQIKLGKPSTEDVIRNFQLSLAEINEHCRGMLPENLRNVPPQSFIQVEIRFIKMFYWC